MFPDELLPDDVPPVVEPLLPVPWDDELPVVEPDVVPVPSVPVVPSPSPSLPITIWTFISPHVYFVSSRFGFTVTVCVPASRPVTSILPFSVVPESESISDWMPLTMTLLLSVTNVSLYHSCSPS